MYGPTGGAINSLAALNTALTTGRGGSALRFFDAQVPAGVNATALAMGDFSQTDTPTAAELDTAIANCGEAVFDFIVRADLIAAIDTQLATDLAEPAGYEAVENSGYWAYISDGYGLDAQARNLLVNAAWNLGEARHTTTQYTGNLNGAHYYIHIYGDNLLYGVTQDGTHRGQWPMVTVVCTGSVNSGVHNFTV